MKFCIRELLKKDIFKDAELIDGEMGLENEIAGVTIIEAPEIVKFIDGGEVLLTGLYAFKDCSVEEFERYISELSKKVISGIVMKRGRDVEHMDTKIQYLQEFARNAHIPLIEVPFEISFRDIMSLIMEKLFNEEVTLLKYFKTTHDNFAALTLSFHSSDKGIDKILDVLAKLIRNPVAVFNHDKICIASTAEEMDSICIQPDAITYEPGFYSHYTYLQQKVYVPQEYHQYLVRFEVNVGIKLYLLICELHSELNVMDFIAIENALMALRQEFSRQYAIHELEKKFHHDILYNVLNGKVHSQEELQKSLNLLELPLNGCYRLIVLGIWVDGLLSDDINAKMHYIDVLGEIVSHVFKKVKICNDYDKLIIIEQVEEERSDETYRQEVECALEKIQKQVGRYHKYMKVKAGASRQVIGIEQIAKGYQEASDALMFLDIASDISGSDRPVVLFSDLGIFKLLCQFERPEQLMEYIPDTLQKLYAYKRPQRDDLLITLKTYLDRNQNLAKTAQDLFIHYKTAAYRVDKISQVTGINFDHANEVLAVRIGLVVYKMIERTTAK